MRCPRVPYPFRFTLSVLECYNESIYDLLSDTAAATATANTTPGSSPAPPPTGRKSIGGGGERERGKGLDIRQGPNGMVVPGLAEVPVDSMEQVRARLLVHT
jgi:Kinesin motor domain